MNRDDYNKHSIDATVARIETKLDIAIAAQVDQNRRLGVLEVAENKRLGAMIAVGTICGFIGTGATMVVEFLKGK